MFVNRVVLQRAGAACTRPLKGGVWPSLPANASDREDSFSTAAGAHIDWAHQPTCAGVAKNNERFGEGGSISNQLSPSISVT